MATPAAAPATAAVPTPSSQPTSTRTPNQSNTSALLTTSISTPHALSQETDQLLRSSFAATTTGSQILSPPEPFPPASTFTFIPDLFNLISRLSLLEGTPQFQGQNQSNSRAATSSPLLSRDTAIKTDPETKSATTETQETTLPDTKEKNQPLDLKDLPENVYEIRQAIQNARDVVAGLPDIGRTVNEQEVEIELLKRTILGLRKRAGELSALARDDKRITVHDVVMQGLEDG